MMKIKTTYVLILFLLFFGISTYAGNLNGYVRDSDTKEPLISATVTIKGTTIGTTTDHNGYYELNVKPGTYTFTASYIGYESVDVELTIEGEGVQKHDFDLQSNAYKISEVNVTVQAKGQLSAINQQMRANTISNIVSSEKIQEVPDANVAESVGRLPGVSVQSSDGEGSKVVVRGLEPRYNLITVNGIRAPSTSSDDNSVSMAGISPFMIDGIEVQKSLTPDKDADVVGGIVDLKLKDAEEGFHVNALIQNRLPLELPGRKFNPLATFQISNRFLDNKLGVIVVGNYDNINRASNRVSNSVANINKNTVEQGGAITRGSSSFTYGDIIRERKGISVFLDYKTDMTTIALSGFVNGLDDDVVDRSFNVAKEGVMTKNINVRELHELSSIYSLGIEQNIGITKLKIGAAYNASERETPYNYSASSRFTWGAGQADQFGYLINGYNVSPYTIGNELSGFVNDSSFYLSSVNSSRDEFKESEIMASLDYEIPITFSDGINGIIKVGGKYRKKNREYDANSANANLTVGQGLENTRPNIRNLNPDLDFRDQEGLISNNQGLPIYNEFDDFSETIIDGGYTLNGYIDPDVVKQIIGSLDRDGWSGNVGATTPSKTYGGDYSGHETTTAFYAMTDMNITEYLKLVGGVRYEKVETDYSSWGIQESTPLDSKLDTLEGQEGIGIRTNDFLLPMFNVKIMPVEWMDIRLAYTQSIARPRYNSFMAKYFLSFDGDLKDIGNPSLKPALSHNYDAYLSFNTSKIGLFTIGGFIKTIEGFEYVRNFNKANPLSVERIKSILPYKFPKTYASMRSVAGFAVNNVFDSYVKGIEADWQTTFWYLPKPFNGLTFSANYTYNVSEQTEIREKLDSVITDERGFIISTTYKDSTFTTPLIGQPKHIINSSLGYDYGGFSIRISYKRTSESFSGFIKAISDLSDDKRINAMYQQVDMSITQKIPKIDGLQVFFNASNVTNQIRGNFAYTTDGTEVLGTSPEKSVAGNDPGKYSLYDEQYSNFIILGLKYKF